MKQRGSAGAVYNDGKLNMGGAVFSGNKAGGKLNDVYNAGELNFTGDVTLDGQVLPATVPPLLQRHRFDG